MKNYRKPAVVRQFLKQNKIYGKFSGNALNDKDKNNAVKKNVFNSIKKAMEKIHLNPSSWPMITCIALLREAHSSSNAHEPSN
jgi:hypothetical protein